MEDRTEHVAPTRSERIHAEACADHLVALVAALDPEIELSEDLHAACAALALACAAAIATVTTPGGAR